MMEHAERSIRPELSLGRFVRLVSTGLLTCFVILAGLEGAARRIFWETGRLSDCLVLNDPTTGARGIPGSFCIQKGLEDPVAVNYKFNSSGYRSEAPFTLEKNGAYRIIVVGSSTVLGYHVSSNQTLAALLSADLSSYVRRKVEVYNEGMYWGTPHSVQLRIKSLLAQHPDLVLWPLTPWDLEHVSMLVQDADANTSTDISKPNSISVAWHKGLSLIDTKSRALFLIKHLLYESQYEYVKQFLKGGSSAEFLRREPSAASRARLAMFDSYLALIKEDANSAGVPFVITLLPQRAQAAMISNGEWATGFDPYRLGEDLRSVANSHGAIYIDTLRGFRHIPHPEDFYLPIDGHPNNVAHRLFSELIAHELQKRSRELKLTDTSSAN